MQKCTPWPLLEKTEAIRESSNKFIRTANKKINQAITCFFIFQNLKTSQGIIRVNL